MFNVFYYKDSRGNSPIADYINSLGAKNDKHSRIKLKKLLDYIEYLSREGINAKEPYVKRLDAENMPARLVRQRQPTRAAWKA